MDVPEQPPGRVQSPIGQKPIITGSAQITEYIAASPSSIYSRPSQALGKTRFKDES